MCNELYKEAYNSSKVPSFVFPENMVENEVWGTMSLSQYRKAARETPKWKMILSLFIPLYHPYKKYANKEIKL